MLTVAITYVATARIRYRINLSYLLTTLTAAAVLNLGRRILQQWSALPTPPPAIFWPREEMPIAWYRHVLSSRSLVGLRAWDATPEEHLAQVNAHFR